MERNDTIVLRVEDLHLSFGGVVALDSVSFDVKEHELLAIIGPNGAGKTCILNCINRFYRQQGGKIYYEGREIDKIPPYKLVKMGVSRVFQHIELYSGLSTQDNLMAARHAYIKYGPMASALYFGKAVREEIEHRKIVEDIIDFLEIEPIRKKMVGALPYGMRKRVDLGRALAAEPKLLLLDEPMAGMNLEEKEDIARFIIDIREAQGITAILVDHDMGVVMDIADRIVVLDFGHLIAEGTPEQIRCNTAVIRAYLGEEQVSPV